MAKAKAKDLEVNPTDVVDSDVAERIRVVMEEAGVTAPEVARTMGVGEKVVYGWARSGQISKHNLPAFCEICNCTEGWLLTGRGSRVYQQQSDAGGVIEFRRSVSEEISPSQTLTIRDTRVADIVDIVNSLPTHKFKKRPDYDAMRRELLETMYANQTEWSSMPVPLLEPDAAGVPHFAVQILSHEHEPRINFSSLVAFTMDLLPNREDFCMMARRSRVEGGMWTIGQGYFHLNQRLTVHDHQEFFDWTSEQDRGMKMALYRLPDTPSVDPFVIDCYHDDWVLVGVGVYAMQWLSDSSRMTQTRLAARLKRRLEMRRRPVPLT